MSNIEEPTFVQNKKLKYISTKNKLEISISVPDDESYLELDIDTHKEEIKKCADIIEEFILGEMDPKTENIGNTISYNLILLYNIKDPRVTLVK